MNGFASALGFAADGFGALTGPIGYGIGVWVLAIVFAWSGIAKLRRPELAALAMVDFGVTRRVRPALGGALGATEAGLATLLPTGVFARPALAGAAVLLWLFVALVARAVWAGERFACFCFGDGGSNLSWMTLARTLALAMLATALALSATPSPLAAEATGRIAQAVAAGSVVGVVVLASYLRPLVEWNRDPLDFGDAPLRGEG